MLQNIPEVHQHPVVLHCAVNISMSVNYLKTELDNIYDTTTVMGYAKAPIHKQLNKHQKRI
jgi:hypothetical protein